MNKLGLVLRKRLKERGITGSAVVPNLEADPEWVSYLAEERDRFYQRIAALNKEL